MTAWLDFVLFNVVGSACLALLAWWVSRRLHRPTLAHTLWLLVLLRLVAPPLVGVDGLPRIASAWTGARAAALGQVQGAHPGASMVPSASLRDPELLGSSPPVASSRFHDPSESKPGTVASRPLLASQSSWAPRVGKVLLLFLFAGTVGVGVMTLVRAWRFRRRLQNEPEAPEELQQRAGELAGILRVSRLPKIRVVSQTIPPSLWPRPWSCEIILPAHLLPRLTADERDMLLAHELAHVRRRDHWIRPLEQLVVALYWWNPVAWWARRQLRLEEEKSCDALVLRKLPHRARAYAEGLLKSLEFLATNPHPALALATGAGNAERLEERMKAILSATRGKRDPGWMKALLVPPAVLALLLAPAWVEDSMGIGEPAAETHVDASMQVHREELKLQRELREIEAKHVQVQMQIEELVQERERLRMLEDLKRLELEGRHEEAEELRLQIARAERDAAFRREQVQQEMELAQRREALEFQMQELQLQREELFRQGETARADSLLEGAREIELRLQRLELESLRDELQRSRKMLDRSRQELEELSKP